MEAEVISLNISVERTTVVGLYLYSDPPSRDNVTNIIYDYMEILTF